ncbi:MAG: LPS export ABC transporter permease LptG [Desulfobacterales bacterium]|nr:LPS export ABC transporter permease LptG [Desulfobacterales bacterium]
MSCLHRYWLKEFTRLFVIIQVMILVLFVFIDYLSRLDRFLRHGVSFIEALWYVVLKLPFMFVQLTPAVIMLATIAVFGIMNRNNELTAIKSSGISAYYLARPVVGVGIFFTLLIFLVGETLIPVSMSKANYIRYNRMAGGSQVSHGRNDVWIRHDQNLVHINFVDPEHGTLAGISVSTMDDDFKIKVRIDAEKGRFEGGQWLLENGVIQTRNAQSNAYDVDYFDLKPTDLGLTPTDLVRVARKSNEMSFFQLRDYVRKVESEGYDATTYRVDMHGKIAFPFICIFMALIGASTGMHPRIKGNMPMGIALGVGMSFLYWSVYGFSLSMGYARALPPVFAAWITNVLFIVGGTIYLIKTE